MGINYEQVKAAAALFYSPVQVGVMVGIDADDIEIMMNDTSSEFYKAYYSGYYSADIKLRNSIMKLATAGSSPAQAMMMKYQVQTETKRFYEQ